MFEVRIEQASVSDETCEIVEWLCEDGQQVEKGQEIVVIETSKAAMDMEAGESGVIHRFASASEERPVGDVIARIFSSEESRQAFLASYVANVPQQESLEKSSITITDKAQKLIDAHNITENELISIGKNVIKASDLKKIIERREPQGTGSV